MSILSISDDCLPCAQRSPSRHEGLGLGSHLGGEEGGRSCPSSSPPRPLLGPLHSGGQQEQQPQQREQGEPVTGQESLEAQPARPLHSRNGGALVEQGVDANR